MQISMKTLSLLCALPIAASSLAAQRASGFEFTIKNIMRGPELYGREPQNVRWSADGKWIYFNWLEPGSDWRLPARPFRVRATPGSAPERVTEAQMDSVAPLLDQGKLSPDGRTKVVGSGGDLFLVDVAAGTSRRLTQTLDIESNPTFSADGRDVYFTRNDNIYALTLDGGLIRQLTDIRAAGAEPPAAAPAGGRGGGRGAGRGASTDTSTARVDTTQRGSLQRQQRELFGVIRDRAHDDSVRRAELASRAALRVHPLSLMSGERISSLAMSPNGRALLITTAIPDTRALATRVPNYVTETGYTEEIPSRTKVGDFQNGGRVAFMSLPSGNIQFLRLSDDNRTPFQVRVLGWTDDGSRALLFSTSSDFKNRWLHVVSADDGKPKLVDTLHDSAWVSGPCFGCGGWFDGGKRFWFVSEADGHAHLYSMAADGSDRKQLTQGNWEVNAVTLSRDGKSFYLTTSEGTPFEQHFYRMAVAGGAREKLTVKVGGHTATLSPDESMIADVYSYANRPPELFVQANRAGAEAAQLTTSPTKEWLAFNWVVPEIVMVPASDGVKVPARIYRPKDMKASANGAAVIFVHGAGYLHNVHNYWSSYAREYMFNQYLASKGYVVLDMDYRGSAGYSRDWRTAIYRWMGGRDLQDEVDGSKYLTKEFGIDPERIGMYGGSYGGFMTLMALFTAPKYFGAGAALRPVTDWAHYNHTYTGQILNTPEKDTLSYRRSSPIFFAEGLEDPLLILHGMVDTNVHFEDSVRLTQRLIELGKRGWWLVPYPVEDHGFVRPDSWTDEYSRIFDLFETTIRRGKTQAQRAAATGGGQP
jgi:dipeptidyl aminopeptidase/acylaminoacyl peptidase